MPAVLAVLRHQATQRSGGLTHIDIVDHLVEVGTVQPMGHTPVQQDSSPQQRDSRGPVAVLGVSGHYHDSAAALVIDGEIVAAAQEERFTRVKFDARLPESAIEYVLRAADIGPGQLTAAVWYESPFAKFDRLASTSLVGQAGAAGRFTSSMRSWLPKKLWVGRQLGDLLGRRVPVLYCDHHLSHAASCYYPSGLDEAAVVTVDGVGEWSTTTIGHGRGEQLELLEHVEYPNSLGLLYSAFTLYCGFKINSGEYKLMGLAPYGEPRFVDAILDEIVHLDNDGSFSLNPKHFAYFTKNKTYTPAFEALFGGPGRADGDELDARFADVAASIQTVCDRAVLGLARRAKQLTGATAVCLAGGVALNVVSVGNIERSGIFDEVWVQPAAGDAGGALGAALWASHQHFAVPHRATGTDTMHGAFLGPRPGEVGDTVEAVLDTYGLVATQLDDTALAERVAALLSGGAIVGVARGRMEFGPRALGNRSILADARDPDMQRRLNIATKLREGFRPFAPVVLAERADDVFDIGDRSSPYMLKTYPVREHLRREPDPVTEVGGDAYFFAKARQQRSTIPAVTHLDHSARVQTVDAVRHPFVHDVLTRFDAQTACPVLVNTSFNVRGEPIVASAVDAVECFLHVDIDALVLEDHLIVKRDQPAGALQPRRALAAGSD
jgi:carbamoyltransferase